MTATSEPVVTIYGWELHYSGGGSDKFYRVLVLDETVLINYGRRATRGQFIAHRYLSDDGAQSKARMMTNEKAAEGYVVTRDMTEFEVEQVHIRDLAGLQPGAHRNPAPDSCTEIVMRFKDNSRQIATTSREASW